MLALSRVQVSQLSLIRQLIDITGSAKILLENAGNLNDILPEATPQLKNMLSNPALMESAEKEMEFIEKNKIKPIYIGEKEYPYRLFECDDAPLVLFTLGNTDFNAKHIVSIVGTRHASEYGKGLCESFVAYPAYLHCTHGVDRAGTISLILEALLGVDKADLIRDYELSNFFYPEDKVDRNYDRNGGDIMTLISKLESDYDGATLADKTADMLQKAGVTQAQIDTIRSIFIAK